MSEGVLPIIILFMHALWPWPFANGTPQSGSRRQPALVSQSPVSPDPASVADVEVGANVDANKLGENSSRGGSRDMT